MRWKLAIYHAECTWWCDLLVRNIHSKWARKWAGEHNKHIITWQSNLCDFHSSKERRRGSKSFEFFSSTLSKTLLSTPNVNLRYLFSSKKKWNMFSPRGFSMCAVWKIFNREREKSSGIKKWKKGQEKLKFPFTHESDQNAFVEDDKATSSLSHLSGSTSKHESQDWLFDVMLGGVVWCCSVEFYVCDNFSLRPGMIY